MKKILNSAAVFKIIAGMLLIGSDLFAQGSGGDVDWSRIGAVPMSATMLAVMAGLFLIAGTWLLLKKQKYAQGVLTVALIATGAFSYKAYALVAEIVITNASGTSGTETMIYGQTLINDSDFAIQVTAIRPELPGCFVPTIPPAPEDTCQEGMTLQTGEFCTFYAYCTLPE